MLKIAFRDGQWCAMTLTGMPMRCFPTRVEAEAYLASYRTEATMQRADGTTVRMYAKTPTTERLMLTRQEIQNAIAARATEIAKARNYSVPAAFELRDAKEAQAEIERDLDQAPTSGRTQRARASEHFGAEVRRYVNQGLSHGAAVERVLADERQSGLRAIRAPLPKGSPWAAEAAQHDGDGARAFSKTGGSKIGREMVRTFEAGVSLLPTTHGEASLTGADLLPKRIAASVLHRGGVTPNQIEINWLSDWWEVNYAAPKPVAGSSGAELDRYDQARLSFVEQTVRAAAAILRDPIQRAQFAPMKLW